MKSKTYNGLDLLKFIMALFVVMIHVKPNVHSEMLTTVFNPILSISVPIFFVLSSVLIFKKLINVNGGDCPKSQTFLSENRESAFGLV